MTPSTHPFEQKECCEKFRISVFSNGSLNSSPGNQPAEYLVGLVKQWSMKKYS